MMHTGGSISIQQQSVFVSLLIMYITITKIDWAADTITWICSSSSVGYNTCWNGCIEKYCPTILASNETQIHIDGNTKAELEGAHTHMNEV
jgi:hypothetical protein